MATSSIRQIYKTLHKAGYETRSDQVKMSEAVALSMTKQQLALIEGGTGIGKTFAYLIPAILNAKVEQTIVISTATVHLQQQILNKDIPELEKILGIQINAQIAKGRKRYLCPHKLYQLSPDMQSQLIQGASNYIDSTVPSKEDLKSIHFLLDTFERQVFSGDQDDLPLSIEPMLWDKITNDSIGCGAQNCPMISQCPYYLHKKKLQKANIIVTNHDLLLSDIKMGTGVLLPEASKCFYIIDEAHHLATKSIDHFSAHSYLSPEPSIHSKLKKALSYIRTQNPDIHEAILTQESLELMTQSYGLFVEQLMATYDHPQVEYQMVHTIAPPLKSTLEPLHQHLKQLMTHLVSLREALLDCSLIEKNHKQNLISPIAECVSRCQNLSTTVARWLSPPNQTNIAKWLTRSVTSKKHNPHMTIHSAHIGTGHLLDQHFWSKLGQGAVLCSATLQTLGNFDHIIMQLGLKQHAPCTYAFVSPFNYPKSTLAILNMKHAPIFQNITPYIDELVSLIPDLVAQEPGGVLMLFSSHHLMEAVYERIAPSFNSLIKQGDLPKYLLLKKHCDAIDQGEQSIVLGLQSFAEGIDLKGHYCQHVIITKLSFNAPDSPIEQAISHHYKMQGQNAFYQHSLPEAALKLTQAVGRLVRTAQDTGRITLCDRRIIDKHYGQMLLKSLPNFTIDAKLPQTENID